MNSRTTAAIVVAVAGAAGLAGVWGAWPVPESEPLGVRELAPTQAAENPPSPELPPAPSQGRERQDRESVTAAPNPKRGGHDRERDPIGESLAAIPLSYRRLPTGDAEAGNPHLAGVASVVGKVVDLGGRPIPGAVVTLGDPNRPTAWMKPLQLAGQRGVRTGPAGEFTIANAVVFKGGGHATTLYCTVLAGRDRWHLLDRTVELRPGPALEVMFEVETSGPGVIEGRVDFGGAVPPRAVVSLDGSPARGGRLTASDSIQPDGGYRLSNLPPGRYSLLVRWSDADGVSDVRWPLSSKQLEVAKAPVSRDARIPVALLHVRWERGVPPPEGGWLMVYGPEDEVAAIHASEGGRADVWIPVDRRLRFQHPWTGVQSPLDLAAGETRTIQVNRPAADTHGSGR